MNIHASSPPLTRTFHSILSLQNDASTFDWSDSGKPVAVVSPENRILEQQKQHAAAKPPPLNPAGSSFGVKGGAIPPPPSVMAPSGPPGHSPGRGGPASAGGLLQQHPRHTPPHSQAVAAPPAWATCIRIESAPEDVSSADVFDYFDGLSITSNGVHIHIVPGSGKDGDDEGCSLCFHFHRLVVNTMLCFYCF